MSWYDDDEGDEGKDDEDLLFRVVMERTGVTSK
jgi:hypothetical protein